MNETKHNCDFQKVPIHKDTNQDWKLICNLIYFQSKINTQMVSKIIVRTNDPVCVIQKQAIS